MTLREGSFLENAVTFAVFAIYAAVVAALLAATFLGVAYVIVSAIVKAAS